MWLTLNRSSANCVFMVALVMLMPERNSTTGLPSSVPVLNSTPFTLYLRGACRRSSSSVSSGWKAEITAVRGTVSSRMSAAGVPRPAQPDSASPSRPANANRYMAGEAGIGSVAGAIPATGTGAAAMPVCSGMACLGYFAVDLGCESSTFTLNLPDRISASRAFTRAMTSAGTLFSKVPSGASSEPLFFMCEYTP